MMTTQNSRYAGIRAYTSEKNRTVMEKTTAAIDEMLRNGDRITFDAVAKKAGVARSTLYYNSELCGRIKNMRTTNKNATQMEQDIATDSDIVSALRRQITDLQAENRRLKENRSVLITQKEKLIAQLVYFDELKEENMHLKNQLIGKAK